MQKMDMPHFSTHNPLKKELNLENIYQYKGQYEK